MRGRYRHYLAIAALIFGGPAWAADISLAWDPSPSTGVTGYKIHYGTASGQYTTIVDVGNVLTATIPGFAENGTTYYFAATAYDATSESVFSNEVFKTLGTAPPPTCPCSLFAPTDVPGGPYNDSQSITVGTKFAPTVNGKVTAIRYYNGTTNADSNTVQLWASGGTVLASKTQAKNTSIGWKEATLDTPVDVVAGQEYTVSVWSQAGDYMADNNYFTDIQTRGPLTTPVTAGVYAYGAAQFPTNSYQDGNYWVDVVFTTTTGTPPTMPVPQNLRVTQ